MKLNNKSKLLAIRVDDSTYVRLTQLSDILHISVSEIVRQYIVSGLNKNDGEVNRLANDFVVHVVESLIEDYGKK